MKIPNLWTYDEKGFKPVTLWMIITAILKHWLKRLRK